MKNLNKILHTFLSTLELNNKIITVGFSGGADSTALLHTLSQKRDFFNFNLNAVFFSHGDSPLAKDEHLALAFCQKFCKEHNIKFTNVPLELEKISRQGWESSGRKSRQAFYEEHHTDYVFLGHHQDDQNETTMTQLFRGGGKGTTGMAENDGFYCRPFLSVYKKDIEEYLTFSKIDWIEDPTNKNSQFTRNFWRNEALPTIELHYPQYRKTLEKFRIKQNELYELSYELAKVDGLELILNGNNVDISNLSDSRFKNLLSYVFPALGKSMEDKFYEQQISHYKANKKLNVIINENEHIALSIEKGNMLITSTPNNKLKINH